MIDRAEIEAFAAETNLQPHVVEKDFTLSWILWGIHTQPALSDTWVFKGGTCLKKCYFETYRFSEDLDFTLKDASHLDEAFLQEQFSEISKRLYDRAGVTIPTERLRFDLWEHGGRTLCQGRVYYESNYQGSKHAMPVVKLDLRADELLASEPVVRPVAHPYSDHPGEGMWVLSYSYEEVFAEKIRALSERSRPRDLYDVVHQYRQDVHPADPVKVRDYLKRKCAFKGISVPSLETLGDIHAQVVDQWVNMLAHQVQVLPPIESFLEVLPRLFAWLESGADASARLNPIPAAEHRSNLYRPASGRLGLGGRTGAEMETIRFAAANRLLVELDYTNLHGVRSTRLIEPYSLYRTQDGNTTLYAVRAEDGETRQYRVDHINAARATDRAFIPRYRIELTPALADYDADRLTSLTCLGRVSRTRVSPQSSRRRSTAWSQVQTFKVRCPYCNKVFRRKTRDLSLREHKGSLGMRCPGSGRRGFQEF